MTGSERIVVFDGLCNLCSGGMQWLERHQGTPPYRLVPMQSDLGRALLLQYGYNPDDPLTFLVLDGGQCLTQSDAWLHLVAGSGAGSAVVGTARVIPRCWRDTVYRLVARNRFRWFGRRNSCYLPKAPPDSGPAPPQPSVRQRT